MAIKVTQSALVGGPDGKIILSHSAPLPTPLEDLQISVDVKAVSLNPVDTKMTGDYFTEGATSGCEFAGIATGIGAKVSRIKVGDRVAGVVLGMNPLRPTIGAFAQHTVSGAHATVRIPDDWTFEKATAGVGGVAWDTVPWALFNRLGLPPGPLLEPLNGKRPKWEAPGPKIPIVTSHTIHTSNGKKAATTVLVNGGASFTGTCAIQLLKLAGFTVITTCSPRSNDLVKSFGADFVFDYASPTIVEDIKAHTRNSLRLVLDCITTHDTTKLCYAAMGRAGGRYVALDPFSPTVAGTRAIVYPDWVFGMDLLGEDVAWPAPHGRDADPVATAFGAVWNATLQSLLDRGLIKPHPMVIRDTGLQGALEGLDEIRSRKGAAQKLVYAL
ncbi:hypothetical protein N7501_007552 [Penicillium viridicatum]|nr:hypothetical protein N7501_007552 [Penicillium viridicatum]